MDDAQRAEMERAQRRHEQTLAALDAEAQYAEDHHRMILAQIDAEAKGGAA